MPVEWHTLDDGVVIYESDEDGTLCSDACIMWEGPVLDVWQ
jgi:hypothetical protein